MSADRWDGLTRHREPAAAFDFGLTDDVPIDPNPLEPHPEHPTPIELVVRLTASERETRVKRLVEMAWNRYDEAVDVLGAGKNIAAVCSLVSGGNDSYTVAHIFRSMSTHFVHANTGAGIEQTRQHVRDTAAKWGKPLLEVHPKPGEGYADLVRGQVWAVAKESGLLEQSWPGGFPGPAAHFVMQQRLKGRGLATVPHLVGVSGSRTDRVMFIAGRRRSESKRRATVPHYEADKSIKTILRSSPIAVWHKADLRAYRLMVAAQVDLLKKELAAEAARTGQRIEGRWGRDALEAMAVPSNPVAKVLGMSGECGCLSNAVSGEAQQWKDAYPNDPFIRLIHELEAELADRTDIAERFKHCGWGGDYDEPEPVKPAEGLCATNCGPDPIYDLMDPLFEDAA